MNFIHWQKFQKLRELLQETAPPAAQMAQRLRAMERDIILPVKAAAVGLLFYYLYFTHWLEDAASPRYVAQQGMERFFDLPALERGGCFSPDFCAAAAFVADATDHFLVEFHGRLFPGRIDICDGRLRQHPLLDVRGIDRAQCREQSAGGAAASLEFLCHLLLRAGRRFGRRAQPSNGGVRRNRACAGESR